MATREQILYRRYLKACPPAGTDVWDPEAERAARLVWAEMPLRLRVELCRRCHWAEAVYEMSAPLGRFVDMLRRLTLRSAARHDGRGTPAHRTSGEGDARG